jgi:hypothetical protein
MHESSSTCAFESSSPKNSLNCFVFFNIKTLIGTKIKPNLIWPVLIILRLFHQRNARGVKELFDFILFSSATYDRRSNERSA